VSVHECRVQGHATIAQRAGVRHLVRERVAEGVAEIRKDLRLLEELGGLEAIEPGAEALLLRLVGDCLQQGQRHVTANDRGGLEQALVLGIQAIDAGGNDGVRVEGQGQRRHRTLQPIGAPLTDQRPRLHERADGFLHEEGIALGALDDLALERVEARVRTDEHVQQLVGGPRRDDVQSQLLVVGLGRPAMTVLRPVRDHQQYARRRHAVHQRVEQGLTLGVEPVQVLDHQHQRLDLALAQKQSLERVPRLPAALGGGQASPVGIVDGNVEEREQRRR
jgi:hypothetical protein